MIVPRCNTSGQVAASAGLVDSCGVLIDTSESRGIDMERLIRRLVLGCMDPAYLPTYFLHFSTATIASKETCCSIFRDLLKYKIDIFFHFSYLVTICANVCLFCLRVVQMSQKMQTFARICGNPEIYARKIPNSISNFAFVFVCFREF